MNWHRFEKSHHKPIFFQFCCIQGVQGSETWPRLGSLKLDHTWTGQTCWNIKTGLRNIWRHTLQFCYALIDGPCVDHSKSKQNVLEDIFFKHWYRKKSVSIKKTMPFITQDNVQGLQELPVRALLLKNRHGSLPHLAKALLWPPL